MGAFCLVTVVSGSFDRDIFQHQNNILTAINIFLLFLSFILRITGTYINAI